MEGWEAGGQGSEVRTGHASGRWGERGGGRWVRTRESGGGLRSEGGKGGLLHSQLVELGQLLKGQEGEES